MAARTEILRIKIDNVRVPADHAEDITGAVSRNLGIDADGIQAVTILRKSTDARQRRVVDVYTLAIEARVDPAQKERIFSRQDVSVYRPAEENPIRHRVLPSQRIVIIGTGPAGLFAALTLIERGARPIVVERGDRIPGRVHKVRRFWEKGHLDPDTNVLFGEGGAGTFSDGKLTSRSKSPLKRKVLAALVQAGAPGDILYINRPHIGTDTLRSIVPRIVDALQAAGAEFLFNTPVTDIVIEGRKVTGVTTADTFIPAEYVFLTTGHSARDIYACLERRQVRMVPKGCAVGLRIEHPRDFIDRSRRPAGCTSPAADYFYSFKDVETSRGVYTFCMCPGGQVIACASEPGELCLNGMSTYARHSAWSNAAVVVTVSPSDYASPDPRAAIDFQRSIERAVYAAGQGSYYAPAQRARDFVIRAPQLRPVTQSSYEPGILTADLHQLLPGCIAQPIARALADFDSRMPGFIDEGILVAAETRTSSPVRIERDERTLHATGVFGLIPAGEGSGYAGGIVSSAVDGIQAALRFDR